MRKYLLALLAVFALFAGACGASGDDDSAEDRTTTTEAEGGTEDTTDDDADDTTTTTEDEGGSSGDVVEVEQWAEGFCGNFEAWLDGITASGENLSGSISPGDLEGAKAAIVGLFEDVSGQTETLIEEIKANGAPDIDQGEDFQADLIAKFEDFQAAISTARDEAAAASTADPAAFQATISDLVATFQTETQTVGDSFSELDAKYGDADLDAAVREACTFM